MFLYYISMKKTMLEIGESNQLSENITNDDVLTKNTAMRKYSIDGWCFLRSKYLKIEHAYKDQTSTLLEQVTDSNEISVYLDQGRCGDDEDFIKNYHVVYKSDTGNGFTVVDILNLIIKTYLCAVNDIYDGNESFLDLALHTFEYDPTSMSVYPSTDS